MRSILFACFCLFLAGNFSANAQSLERRPGELLVQLRADASPASVLNRLNQTVQASMTWKDAVAPDWQIYLLGFDEAAVDPAAVLAATQRLGDIRFAQWNHRVFERIAPDDPDWSLQDDKILIGMPDAWEVSTGGLSNEGDTIVVAVLEKGALLSHPDLEPNVWYNWGEEPGNGIDDDNNGYIDDFRGWNPRTGNDDPGAIGFHGTAVNGIIGARGNNGMGVTGVNWNIKLMSLANVEYESEIVAAYNYVAKMRKLYNQSNGAQGAFVVATNASFGIDYEWASSHPLWCAAYDSLGKVGVLSVAATANQDIDVDALGDMPCTCPSEYLVTVNNIDKFDKKVATTGYGDTYIDLGAPGQSIYTTYSQGTTPKYGSNSGTSFAAPQVTGALGFIYSLQCEELVVDALSAPDSCARRIRDLLLQNVSPNETLKNKTTTEGRLDVAAVVKAVQEFCGGSSSGILEILWARPNPVHTELKVRFQTPAYVEYTILVHNMLGQLMFEDTLLPTPFSNNVKKLDVSALPAGVYSVSFGRNDAWRSVKFVKN